METPLSEKGTGVRGGVLVAMLRYLAENSRRSMIFCIEEPEAFLHPGAQEELRDDLEALAERRDVSLLITTHSPFVISRNAKSRVISVAKNGFGKAVIPPRLKGTSHGRVFWVTCFAMRRCPTLSSGWIACPATQGHFLLSKVRPTEST